jgi:periplasmic divalent cation tolerance protein
VAEDGSLIVVYITTRDETEARKLASLLLESRKAACVNVVPCISSLYRWHGKIEDETESLMIVKTTHSLLHDIIALVKENHSYEVPEVIALPVTDGSPEYVDWIRDELEAPGATG